MPHEFGLAVNPYLLKQGWREGVIKCIIGGASPFQEGPFRLNFGGLLNYPTTFAGRQGLGHSTFSVRLPLSL